MVSMSDLKTARMQVILTPAELEALDEWGWERRIRSRAEVIRRLLELGLAASRAGWSPAAPGTPSPITTVRHRTVLEGVQHEGQDDAAATARLKTRRR